MSLVSTHTIVAYLDVFSPTLSARCRSTPQAGGARHVGDIFARGACFSRSTPGKKNLATARC